MMVSTLYTGDNNVCTKTSVALWCLHLTQTCMTLKAKYSVPFINLYFMINDYDTSLIFH